MATMEAMSSSSSLALKKPFGFTIVVVLSLCFLFEERKHSCKKECCEAISENSRTISKINQKLIRSRNNCPSLKQANLQ